MRGAFSLLARITLTTLLFISVWNSQVLAKDKLPPWVSKAIMQTVTYIQSGSTKQDLTHIEEISSEPSFIVLSALLLRASSELIGKKNPQKDASFELIQTCIENAAMMAEPKHLHLFESLFEVFEKYLKGVEKYETEIAPIMAEIPQFVKDNRNLPLFTGPIDIVDIEVDENNSPSKGLGQLLSRVEEIRNSTNPDNQLSDTEKLRKQYQDLEEQADEEASLTDEERFSKAITRIKEMRKFLEDRIIGQPEIIDAIIDTEFKKAVLGTSGPKGIYQKWMGLPGVGKDTSVMAWVDAIHNTEDAWLEHMYTISPLRTKHDISSLIGSTAGLVGSDDIPAFLQFLVKHSAGRYMILETGGKSAAKKGQSIVKNPKWKPGMVFPGYYTPDQAVVFLNESHNWSKAGKDMIKTFIEEGRIQVANPGTAPEGFEIASELIVPVRRVEASNEGMGLISNLRVDGSRIGSPLSFEDTFKKWEQNHLDFELIRQTIIDEGVNKSGAGEGQESQFGTSVETLNRVPDRHLLLMRPLSPEDLKKILRIKLSAMAKLFARSKTGFKGLKLQFTDRLIDFLQEWNYVVDSGARPMQDRVEGLVETSIFDAIQSGDIEPGIKDDIYLDVKRNEDGTYKLVFKKKDGTSFEQFIRGTESAKYQEPLSSEEMIELYKLGERLSRHVFGIEELTDEIGKQIAIQIKNRKNHVTPETAEFGAVSFGFLGLSSTGKTELSKAIAREVYDDEERMITIPFGDIKTAQQLNRYIFGEKQGNRVIKSRLMEKWDLYDGKFVLNLDELANAPAEIQEALYDLLREKVFNGFADGKSRPTENLIITVTGNTGEDEYHQLPRQGIPVVEQQAALYEIHRQLQNDPNRQREILEKGFKKALLNRIGFNNIYFFPPLSYQAIRKLTQVRLAGAISSLKPERHKVGWNIQFLDMDAYLGTVRVVETEGFELFSQGASLVQFASDFKDNLDIALGSSGVKSGENVILYIKDITPQKLNGMDTVPGEVVFGLLIPDENREVEMRIKRRKEVESPEFKQEYRIFTAAHETGHELVNKVLFGDIEQSNFITIVPGVTKIQDKWIRYAGLASSTTQVKVEVSREFVIRRMAVLSGGEMAEALLSKGARSNAGKSNDMTRSNGLAYQAILCLGLSKNWREKYGMLSCPDNKDPYTWVQETFSDEMKVDLHKEIKVWLDEARALARDILLSNFEIFEEMSVELAEEGTLDREMIDGIYSKHKLVKPENITNRLKIRQFRWGKLFARFSHWFPKHRQRDAEFIPAIRLPEKIASIEEILTQQKTEALESVQLPEDIPLAANTESLLQMIDKMDPESMPETYKYGCKAALRSTR